MTALPTPLCEIRSSSYASRQPTGSTQFVTLIVTRLVVHVSRPDQHAKRRSFAPRIRFWVGAATASQGQSREPHGPSRVLFRAALGCYCLNHHRQACIATRRCYISIIVHTEQALATANSPSFLAWWRSGAPDLRLLYNSCAAVHSHAKNYW